MGARAAYKWLARYLTVGAVGLVDRSSRPARCPYQLSDKRRERVMALRRERRSYRHISRKLDVPVSTIARVLQQAGRNRLAALDPAPPVRSYTHEAPGDLLHLDIKKLGGFRRPVIVSPDAGRAGAQAQGGIVSTSPSMITAVLAGRPSSPMRPAPALGAR